MDNSNNVTTDNHNTSAVATQQVEACKISQQLLPGKVLIHVWDAEISEPACKGQLQIFIYHENFFSNSKWAI